MKTLIVLAIALGLATSETFAASIETNANGLAPWYSCAGKKTGNYIHPRDCHMFISCTDGGLAYEMDCGPCNPNTNPAQCFTGKLIYEPTKDQCVWENEATCSSTTDSPTDSPTDAPTDAPTEAATNPPDTTESATSSPIDGECVRPANGSSCKPEECRTCGFCKEYWVCNKATKQWEFGDCGQGSFYNPWAPGKIHGGDCSPWSELPAHLKEKLWRPDSNCLECKWQSLGECKNEYEFMEPNSPTLVFQKVKCGKGLVFDEKKLACLHCSVTLKKDGSACCTDKIPTDI